MLTADTGQGHGALCPPSADESVAGGGFRFCVSRGPSRKPATGDLAALEGPEVPGPAGLANAVSAGPVLPGLQGVKAGDRQLGEVTTAAQGSPAPLPDLRARGLACGAGCTGSRGQVGRSEARGPRSHARPSQPLCPRAPISAPGEFLAACCAWQQPPSRPGWDRGLVGLAAPPALPRPPCPRCPGARPCLAPQLLKHKPRCRPPC